MVNIEKIEIGSARIHSKEFLSIFKFFSEEISLIAYE